MNIVEEKGRLADNLKDALMDIVSYLAGKMGISEMEFTFFRQKPAACCEKKSLLFCRKWNWKRKWKDILRGGRKRR